MIPSPWVGLILALAAYRLTRLLGWDDFPLAAKIRAAVIGERWVPEGAISEVSEVVSDEHGVRVTGRLSPVGVKIVRGEDLTPELPGKQPSSEVDGVRPAYDRPTLAHLIHCPFCLGWWVSLTTYLAWLAWDDVLYGLAPLALSGAVGLLAKNLDA